MFRLWGSVLQATEEFKEFHYNLFKIVEMEAAKSFMETGEQISRNNEVREPCRQKSSLGSLKTTTQVCRLKQSMLLDENCSFKNDFKVQYSIEGKLCKNYGHC